MITEEYYDGIAFYTDDKEYEIASYSNITDRITYNERNGYKDWHAIGCVCIPYQDNLKILTQVKQYKHCLEANSGVFKNDPAFVIDDNKVTDFFTGTAHTSSDAIRRAEERRIVKDEILDYINHIKTAAIEEFAHELKETFNQEFPRNYPSTKPFFTLDNVRILVDEQVKNCNKCGKLL